MPASLQRYVLVSTSFFLAQVLGCVGKHNIPVRHMQDVAVHYDVGQYIGEALGRYQGSRNQFEIVIDLAPEFAEAHHNLGVSLAHLGEWDESLVEFERVLKLDAQVLRYLIVLHEENPEEPLQEDKPADESEKRDESRDSGREYRDRDRPRVFDYKDERSLSRFTTDTGKILPRRVSGNTARQQRKLSIAIKRARFLALITATGVRSR